MSVIARIAATSAESKVRDGIGRLIFLLLTQAQLPSIAATVGGAFVFRGNGKNYPAAKLRLKTAEYSHHNG